MARLVNLRHSGLGWFFATELPHGEDGPATAFRHGEHVVSPNKKSDGEKHVI